MTDDEGVHVHVHLAMTGTFPLRIADLLFTDSRLLIPEYEFLTPMFGLAFGRLGRAGEIARNRYREDGTAGLVAAAERTHRIRYEGIDRIRVYDDSGLGRPKVAVDVTDGPPYAYRVHAPLEVDRLTEALRALGERRGFGVTSSPTLGFSPVNSLRRFLADR
jgi:hypothetical protein